MDLVIGPVYSRSIGLEDLLVSLESGLLFLQLCLGLVGFSPVQVSLVISSGHV